MMSRWLFIVGIACLALGFGALGGFLVLGAEPAARDSFVAWFGGWSKSAGFGGLCAIIAASIAFAGISRQLKANRDRDADSAWWQAFEWGSDRGLPRDSTSAKLPFEATIDTMNALATSARTSIQKAAVGGIVDEIVRIQGTPSAEEIAVSAAPEQEAVDPPQPDEGEAPVGVDQVESKSAIARYAESQAGTPAESRRASAAAYELEVFRALRHVYGDVMRMGGSAPGDLMVTTSKRRLTLEVKWSQAAVVDLYRREHLGRVDAVISNVTTAHLSPGIHSIVWTPNQGSFALRHALEAIE